MLAVPRRIFNVLVKPLQRKSATHSGQQMKSICIVEVLLIFKAAILCMAAFSNYRFCVCISLCIYLCFLTPGELGFKFNKMGL